MSNIKKLLALVLALTMVLSVSAFAGYTVAPYGDAANVDEDCEVAVQLLYSLEIMKGDDKGNFNPTANITRAEMAKMIYVILNYGKDDKAVNYTGANLFSDVEKGSWYEGYVNYCASTKLIQGDGNGKFHPLDNVTTAAAAKMLLTAIGYSAEGRNYVGANWEKNVLADAAILGLLSGYNYSTTGYAPRQWVAVMVYNMLTTSYTFTTMVPNFSGLLVSGVTFDIDNYPTMGEKYYGLYLWEGVITSNQYADLYGTSTENSNNTFINKGEFKFKNWATDLTEIGEYRWGWAVEDGSKDLVVYVGGASDNHTFSTGADNTIAKKYIDGIKLNDKTEYFLNFDATTAYKADSKTGNGTWLKVIDNDGDGYAEYVFVTEFEMTQVVKVAKDDTVTLASGAKSDEFEMSADVVVGNVVLYTKIDGVEYVEVAESFEGQAEKYTYKTDILTVDGEEYGQSAIDVESLRNDFYTEIESAKRKTDYVFYQDFFGFVRAYSQPTGADGEIVLLTDAYYETKRDGKVYAVNAYLDGELTDVDVDPYYCSDYETFINDLSPNANNWGRLHSFNTMMDEKADGCTNLARYTMDDDGAMRLYTADTYYYNNKGEAYAIKTGYVDLSEEDVNAGQTAYNGVYDDATVKVQVTKDTIFYYVDEDLNIVAVTGYKNSYDVIDDYVDIVDMYCVATNTESDSSKVAYWVADVVVIETVEPVFNLNNNVVLAYDVLTKKVYDSAEVAVIGATGELDELNVINYNGYNKFQPSEIDVPAFYFNTEDEDGDSHIRVNKAYAAYGIYAVKTDRVVSLQEYIVTTKGKTFYYNNETVVYDLTQKSNYVAITTEDDYEDALTLETGCNYIIVVDDDNTIVYAVLVDSWNDVMVDLFNEICAEKTDFEILAAAKTEAIVDLKAEIEASDAWDWTEAEIEIGVKAIENASSAENLREVAIQAVRAARAADQSPLFLSPLTHNQTPPAVCRGRPFCISP